MPPTELNDLKAAWQTMNRNLERQHALALHQFKQSNLARFRSGLRPLAVGQIIQLICGAILAGLSAQFWAGHIGSFHLMTYGILLHGYGVMLAGFAVRDLMLIHAIDYSAPVVAIQKQLAALRAWHVRTGTWFAITGCFIWIPLMLVVFYWLGADVWSAKPEVVSWFLLNGIVAAGLAYWLVYMTRHGQGRFAKYLQASAAGRSVKRAEAALDEIARFEKE